MMTNIEKDNLIKRRDFFTSFARFGVLAGIGGLAVFGEVKRRKLLREGKCVGRGICVNCGSFTECGLPLAAFMKEGRRGATGINPSRQEANVTGERL